MTEIELLNWVRGPAFEFSCIIFVAGIVIRLIEIMMLGRKANLAEPKGSEMSGGLSTIVTRTLPDKSTLQRSTFTIVAGYLFHIGLFVIIFLFAPHILMFKEVSGLSWPSLPSAIVDAFTVVTMITLLAVLFHRFQHRVLRYLTDSEDILVWIVTFVPVLTGYLAFHRIGGTAPMLLAIHILSVELFLIVFPFTKLMHTFTVVLSRWYGGAISNFRGVKS